MFLRILLVVGFTLMVLGSIDPLEGCVLILAGSVLCAFVSHRSASRHRRTVLLSTILITLGVAVLFLLTAMGGVGGNSTHSTWWLLLAAPYPLGWILGLITGVLCLREAFRRGRAVPAAN
ncbi:MAG: hypothetical protein IT160_18810 [Bryobacterales bacterium]|nr:hypothetical protein [Bryobacterales bacterium]